MRHYVANLALLVGGSGCSLIYNPNNIPPVSHDAAPDVLIDAPPDTPVADANPALLELDSFFPSTIDEGTGDLGSRPMMLVLVGHDMIAGASVTFTSTPTVMVTADNSKLQVAADGNSLAVPVTAVVDDTVGEGTTADLTIVVTQPGLTTPVMSTTTLTFVAHDTLTTPPLTGGKPDAAKLNKLYAKVDLGATAITWTGDETHPVVIRSASTINVPAFTVSGGAGTNGNNAPGGGGGPGGCTGGVQQSGGGCAGDGGGGGGAPSTGGGGGGGNNGPGGQGQGGGAGAAGGAHGSDPLVDLATNHGSGGGGGGSSLLAGCGTGGGGGGSIELSAGGNITAGALTAKGGVGGTASGITAAGGGGGGAGGAVVVRSFAGSLTVGTIDVSGGGGGGGVGANNGGAGAGGHVRADSPKGGLSGAHQDPSFAANTVQIVTTNSPMMTVVGTSLDKFDVSVLDAGGNFHDSEPMGLTIGGGTKQFTPTLFAGYNLVCVTIEGGQQGKELSDTCIEVAFLP